jgi:Ca-activated chloride channel family protein
MTVAQKVPQIEFISLRHAVCSDTATTLDVVMKIIPPEPPQPESENKRPPLNLGLVIDRSGSMQGKKIQYAREAAGYAVEQLLPSDRISVTIYDDRIDTLVPSTLATNKTRIIRQIQRITPRSMTNLHGGWVEGGVQVSKYLKSEQLNRIILLSDGLANHGQTNPDIIASDVHGLAQQGVSTSTMGVGDDYNEDLLEAMATSGDGNYYYIESPDQLPEIFDMEMQGIIGLLGQNVTLRIEPQGDVEVVDVFNDFSLTRQGEFKLPNLVMGNPFTVLVRLQVPAIQECTPLCYFRLAWDEADQPERQKLRVELELPVVLESQLDEFPLNADVQREVALMQSARAKKEASEKVREGDYGAAMDLMEVTKEVISRAPSSLLMEQEAQSLEELNDDLQARRLQQYQKRAKYEEQYTRRSSTRYSSRYSQRDYYTKRALKKVCDRIQVIQGDITKQQVDAIVCPENNFLAANSGVAKAIELAAGPEHKQDRDRLNGCNVGEAKIIPGYQLPAKYVIYTVGPIWNGGNHGEAEQLAECYRSCLILAEQQGISSIAFPGISTGGAGFPVDKAAKIAVEQVVNLIGRMRSLRQVIFVCFSQESYLSYLAALK